MCGVRAADELAAVYAQPGRSRWSRGRWAWSEWSCPAVSVRGWDHVEQRPILDATFLLFEEDHGMRCARCDRLVERGQPYQSVPTGMYENGDSTHSLLCVYCVTAPARVLPSDGAT